MQPSTAELSQRLAMFEATVARLESSSLAFRRNRPLYMRGFLALTLAGFACFAFGAMVGIWGSFSASLVSLAGYGMVHLRTSEFSAQIAALRREIDRMRASAPLVS
jgi:uncharacterized small protein (DUF1192 family)